MTAGAGMAAVVIGASAGGIASMRKVIDGIAAELPCPLVLVQHIRPDADIDLQTIYGGNPHVQPVEAIDKELMQAGRLYVAPPGYHLLVERGGTFSLDADEPVHFARPSIDLLFESAAEVFKAGLVGVILSGSNEDGAAGLKAVKAMGGKAVVEDPASAQAAAMPLAALRAAGDVDHVVAAEGIGSLLAELAAIMGMKV